MDSIIENVILTIKEKINPDKIILFGSKIENPDKDSDYDLCILKSNITHKRKLAQYIYKLLYNTKIAVDLIIDTPEHFNELKNEPSFIYYEIMKTGKTIYEKK